MVKQIINMEINNMKFYQIQRNESLCEIAKKFSLSCKELIELNNITNIDDLREGDIIRVK